MKPIVLSLCDYTGNMLKPWAESGGYRCIAVDIQHDEVVVTINGIEYVNADVRHYLPPIGNYAMCFAFPPCTHLAASGARWFKQKGLSKLAEAVEIVEACSKIAEWTQAPWMIENPVSTLSTYWRKPDFTFNPCDYGDPYTKRTCLWTGNGFVMPPKQPVEPIQGSRMHRVPPSGERANIRSATPMGFAYAVHKSNTDMFTLEEAI